MKLGSTNFLRGSIFLMGIVALLICIFVVPDFAYDVAIFIPEVNYLQYAILVWLITPLMPFLFTLYQGLKLLNYIDKNEAFSNLSVNALKNIKYSAAIISFLLLMGMPIVYLMAEKDDAPGLIIIAAIIACSPTIIVTFAAVLQKLLQQAIEIKLENDLTI